MKRLLQSLLLAVVVTLSMSVNAQNTSVTIGTGTSTAHTTPFESYYNNGSCELIYTATEIGTAGQIDTIAFQRASTAPGLAFSNLVVYMATTNATSLSSGWEAINELQAVYTVSSASLGSGEGWETIALDNPFYYNGTESLVIVICRQGSAYSSNQKYAYTTYTGGARYINNDSNPSDGTLAGIASASGSVSANRPNIKMSLNTSVAAPCTRPATIAANNVTATSAQIDFTAGGSETAWVGTITPAVNGSNALAITGTSIALTGLTPNTDYEVAIRSVCGEGDTSIARNLSFTTPCVALTAADLPYTEDFNSYATGSSSPISQCWHKGTNYTYSQYPYPYSSTTIDGTTCLYFYGYRPTSATATAYYSYAALPEFDGNISSLMVSFDAKAGTSTAASYYCRLIVGVMTDPTDITTFQAVDTVVAGNGGRVVNAEVELSSYTGTGRYVAFYNPQPSTEECSNSYAYSYIYLDNVVLEVTPTCRNPRNVVASSYFDTINVHWGAHPSSTSFQVGYGPAGISPDSLTSIINVAADTAASFVAPTGGYDVYVRTNCGTETSRWIGPATAFSNGFNMGSIDTIANLCDFYLFDNGGPAGNYSNNARDTMVIYTTDTCSTIRLSGTLRTENNYDSLCVYFDDNVRALKLMANTETNVDITAPAGFVKLLFYSDGSGAYAGFNLHAECVGRPIAVPFAEGFENGLPCGWKTVYADPNSPNTITAASTAAHSGSLALRMSSYNRADDYTQYFISPMVQLTEMGQVNFWYKRTSGNSDQLWFGTSTTTDDTAAFSWTALPMSTNWAEYETYLPTNVKYIAFKEWGDYAYYSVVDDLTITNAPSCIPVQGLVAANPTDTSLTLSWTDLRPTTSWQISYDTVTVVATTNPFVVEGLLPYTTYTFSVAGICNDSTMAQASTCAGTTLLSCGSTLAHSDTLGNGTVAGSGYAFNGYSWYSKGENHVIYTGAELHEMGMGVNNLIHGIRLHAASTGEIRQAKVYVKEVALDSFESLSDTIAKSEMALVYSGTLTANGTWMPIVFDAPYNYTGAGNLLVCFSRDTNEVGSVEFVSTSGDEDRNLSIYTTGTYHSGSLDDVRPNVIFDYCSEEASCLYVTDVTVSNIVNDSATISWSVIDTNQTNFIVAYGTDNTPDQMTTVAATTNSAVITGLAAATVYNVYVKAVCDSANSSIWSLPATFATPICSSENQCSVTLHLEDEYGDGWNGASLAIVDSLTNIEMWHGALQNGPDSINIDLPLCGDRTYSLFWTPGSYDSECSIVIRDANGNVLFSEYDMGLEDGYVASFTHTCVTYYTLNVMSNDTNMGTVTGAGRYVEGDTVMLTATPAAHHNFVMWSDSITTNPRQVVMTQNYSFNAIFAIDQFTVTVNADTTMGTVTGAGIYNYGDTITLTATAAEHHHFVMWSDSITTNPRQLIAESDYTVSAIFELDQYNVAVAVNDTAMGTVNGAGSYGWGTQATLTAVAAPHYTFVAWNDGNTENPRVITVAADTLLTATFEAETYTVTVNANDATMGTVTGAGEYTYLDEVTITATANEGFHFVRWNNGDTNAVVTFVAMADVEYTAIFEANVGINDIDMSGIKINARNLSIAINGAEGQMVRIFDVQGRMIVNEMGNDGKIFRMPATGVYMVKVGNYPAQKVVVVK